MPKSLSMPLLPPTYLLASFVLMVTLHNLLPGWRLWGRPWTYWGMVPFVIGFMIAMVSAWTLANRGTTIQPNVEPTVLVTDRMFRFSRNPIYLGMVLMLIGVAVILGTAVPWLVVGVFVWAMRGQFIEPEEAVLAEKFGGSYDDYRSRVRRWL